MDAFKGTCQEFGKVFSDDLSSLKNIDDKVQHHADALTNCLKLVQSNPDSHSVQKLWSGLIRSAVSTLLYIDRPPSDKSLKTFQTTIKPWLIDSCFSGLCHKELTGLYNLAMKGPWSPPILQQLISGATIQPEELQHIFDDEVGFIENRIRCMYLSGRRNQLITFGMATLLHPEIKKNKPVQKVYQSCLNYILTEEDLIKQIHYFDLNITISLIDELLKERGNCDNLCNATMKYLWQQKSMDHIEEVTTQWVEWLNMNHPGVAMYDYIAKKVFEGENPIQLVQHCVILVRTLWKIVPEESRMMCFEILCHALHLLSANDPNIEQLKKGILSSIAYFLPNSQVSRSCVLTIFIQNPTIEHYFEVAKTYKVPYDRDKDTAINCKAHLRLNLLEYLQQQWSQQFLLSNNWDWPRLRTVCYETMSGNDSAYVQQVEHEEERKEIEARLQEDLNASTNTSVQSASSELVEPSIETTCTSEMSENNSSEHNKTSDSCDCIVCKEENVPKILAMTKSLEEPEEPVECEPISTPITKETDTSFTTENSTKSSNAKSHTSDEITLICPEESCRRQSISKSGMSQHLGRTHNWSLPEIHVYYTSLEKQTMSTRLSRSDKSRSNHSHADVEMPNPAIAATEDLNKHLDECAKEVSVEKEEIVKAENSKMELETLPTEAEQQMQSDAFKPLVVSTDTNSQENTSESINATQSNLMNYQSTMAPTLPPLFQPQVEPPQPTPPPVHKEQEIRCPVSSCTRVFRHRHTIQAHIEFKHKINPKIAAKMAKSAKYVDSVPNIASNALSSSSNHDDIDICKSRGWYWLVDDFIFEDTSQTDHPSFNRKTEVNLRSSLARDVISLLGSAPLSYDLASAEGEIVKNWKFAKKSDEIKNEEESTSTRENSKVIEEWAEEPNIGAAEGNDFEFNHNDMTEPVKNEPVPIMRSLSDIKSVLRMKVKLKTPIIPTSTEVAMFASNSHHKIDKPLNDQDTKDSHCQTNFKTFGPGFGKLDHFHNLVEVKTAKFKRVNKNEYPVASTVLTGAFMGRPLRTIACQCCHTVKKFSTQDLVVNKTKVPLPKKKAKLAAEVPPQPPLFSSDSDEVLTFPTKQFKRKYDVQSIYHMADKYREVEYDTNITGETSSGSMKPSFEEALNYATSTEKVKNKRKISTSKFGENGNRAYVDVSTTTLKKSRPKKNKSIRPRLCASPSLIRSKVDSTEEKKEEKQLADYTELLKHAEEVNCTKQKSAKSAHPASELPISGDSVNHKNEVTSVSEGQSLSLVANENPDILRKRPNKLLTGKRRISLRKLSSTSKVSDSTLMHGLDDNHIHDESLSLPSEQDSLYSQNTNPDEADVLLSNPSSPQSSQASTDVLCPECLKPMTCAFALACHMRKRHKIRSKKVFFPGQSPKSSNNSESGEIKKLKKHSKNELEPPGGNEVCSITATFRMARNSTENASVCSSESFCVGSSHLDDYSADVSSAADTATDSQSDSDFPSNSKLAIEFASPPRSRMDTQLQNEDKSVAMVMQMSLEPTTATSEDVAMTTEPCLVTMAGNTSQDITTATLPHVSMATVSNDVCTVVDMDKNLPLIHDGDLQGTTAANYKPSDIVCRSGMYCCPVAMCRVKCKLRKSIVAHCKDKHPFVHPQILMKSIKVDKSPNRDVSCKSETNIEKSIIFNAMEQQMKPSENSNNDFTPNYVEGNNRSLRRIAYEEANLQIQLTSSSPSKRKWTDVQELAFLYNKRVRRKVAQALSPAHKEKDVKKFKSKTKRNRKSSGDSTDSYEADYEAQLPCWACQAIFHRRKNLTTHIQHHIRNIDVFKYRCDHIACLFGFSSQEELNLHKRRHMKVHCHICLFCPNQSRCFTSIQQLSIHEHLEHGELKINLNQMRKHLCLKPLRCAVNPEKCLIDNVIDSSNVPFLASGHRRESDNAQLCDFCVLKTNGQKPSVAKYRCCDHLIAKSTASLLNDVLCSVVEFMAKQTGESYNQCCKGADDQSSVSNSLCTFSTKSTSIGPHAKNKSSQSSKRNKQNTLSSSQHKEKRKNLTKYEFEKNESLSMMRSVRTRSATTKQLLVFKEHLQTCLKSSPVQLIDNRFCDEASCRSKNETVLDSSLKQNGDGNTEIYLETSSKQNDNENTEINPEHCTAFMEQNIQYCDKTPSALKDLLHIIENDYDLYRDVTDVVHKMTCQVEIEEQVNYLRMCAFVPTGVLYYKQCDLSPNPSCGLSVYGYKSEAFLSLEIASNPAYGQPATNVDDISKEDRITELDDGNEPVMSKSDDSNCDTEAVTSNASDYDDMALPSGTETKNDKTSEIVDPIPEHDDLPPGGDSLTTEASTPQPHVMGQSLLDPHLLLTLCRECNPTWALDGDIGHSDLCDITDKTIECKRLFCRYFVVANPNLNMPPAPLTGIFESYPIPSDYSRYLAFSSKPEEAKNNGSSWNVQAIDHNLEDLPLADNDTLTDNSVVVNDKKSRLSSKNSDDIEAAPSSDKKTLNSAQPDIFISGFMEDFRAELKNKKMKKKPGSKVLKLPNFFHQRGRFQTSFDQSESSDTKRKRSMAEIVAFCDGFKPADAVNFKEKLKQRQGRYARKKQRDKTDEVEEVCSSTEKTKVKDRYKSSVAVKATGGIHKRKTRKPVTTRRSNKQNPKLGQSGMVMYKSFVSIPANKQLIPMVKRLSSNLTNAATSSKKTAKNLIKPNILRKQSKKKKATHTSKASKIDSVTLVKSHEEFDSFSDAAKSLDETEVSEHELSVNQASVNQASVNQASVNQAAVNQASVSQASVSYKHVLHDHCYSRKITYNANNTEMFEMIDNFSLSLKGNQQVEEDVAISDYCEEIDVASDNPDSTNTLLVGRQHPSKSLLKSAKVFPTVNRNQFNNGGTDQISNPQEVHQCPVCLSKCNNSTGFIQHLNLNHIFNQKLFKCRFPMQMNCFFSFDTKHELIEHEHVHQGPLPYPCLFCPRWFATMTAFKSHFFQNHRTLSEQYGKAHADVQKRLQKRKQESSKATKKQHTSLKPQKDSVDYQSSIKKHIEWNNAKHNVEKREASSLAESQCFVPVSSLKRKITPYHYKEVAKRLRLKPWRPQVPVSKQNQFMTSNIPQTTLIKRPRPISIQTRPPSSSLPLTRTSFSNHMNKPLVSPFHSRNVTKCSEPRYMERSFFNKLKNNGNTGNVSSTLCVAHKSETFASPSPTLMEKPLQMRGQAPSQMVVQAQSEMFGQAPSQMVVQAQSEMFGQAPSQMVGQAPSQMVIQAPTQMVVQSPSRMVVQASSQLIGQTPSRMIGQVPSQMLGQVPSLMAVQAPTQMVCGQAPSQIVGQAPSQMVLQTPTQMVVQAPSQLVHCATPVTSKIHPIVSIHQMPITKSCAIVAPTFRSVQHHHKVAYRSSASVQSIPNCRRVTTDRDDLHMQTVPVAPMRMVARTPPMVATTLSASMSTPNVSIATMFANKQADPPQHPTHVSRISPIISIKTSIPGTSPNNVMATDVRQQTQLSRKSPQQAQNQVKRVTQLHVWSGDKHSQDDLGNSSEVCSSAVRSHDSDLSDAIFSSTHVQRNSFKNQNFHKKWDQGNKPAKCSQLVTKRSSVRPPSASHASGLIRPMLYREKLMEKIMQKHGRLNEGLSFKRWSHDSCSTNQERSLYLDVDKLGVSDINFIECDFCSNIYSNYIDFKSHMLDDHSLHLCDFPNCDNIFGSDMDLQHHYDIDHERTTVGGIREESRDDDDVILIEDDEEGNEHGKQSFKDEFKSEDEFESSPEQWESSMNCDEINLFRARDVWNARMTRKQREQQPKLYDHETFLNGDDMMTMIFYDVKDYCKRCLIHKTGEDDTFMKCPLGRCLVLGERRDIYLHILQRHALAKIVVWLRKRNEINLKRIRNRHEKDLKKDSCNTTRDSSQDDYVMSRDHDEYVMSRDHEGHMMSRDHDDHMMSLEDDDSYHKYFGNLISPDSYEDATTEFDEDIQLDNDDQYYKCRFAHCQKEIRGQSNFRGHMLEHASSSLTWCDQNGELWPLFNGRVEIKKCCKPDKPLESKSKDLVVAKTFDRSLKVKMFDVFKARRESDDVTPPSTVMDIVTSPVSPRVLLMKIATSSDKLLVQES